MLLGTWGWWGVLLGAVAGVVLRVLVNRYRRVLRERDEARRALIATIGQHAADNYLRTLMDRWAQVSDGVEYADGNEAAHAFADFLANETGQPIVAQQLDGDGVIVAIPDHEQEAT